MPASHLIRTAAICAAAASALAFAGARAGAQAPDQPSTVEELTITGHVNADTLSYRVGYADLDLRTPEGRKELDKRVDIAARYVCGKLNSDLSGIDACRTAAENDARPQERAAVHAARVHTANWKPGPGWTPPPGVEK